MKKTCIALLAMFIASFASAADDVQSYPNRPIRILMAFAPGGGMDFVMRLIAQKLTEDWGQQAILDHKPGASGIIGLQLAAKAAPDGYTLVPSAIGPFAVNPSLYAKLPYDPMRDFDSVTNLVSAVNVLVVNASLPVKSVADLIALAKSKPGQLKYASSGNGTTDHLAGELLETMAGIELIHVPYKGGGLSAAAVLAGDVDMSFSVYLNVAQHVKSGKMRILAVTADKRWPALADVPTVGESLPGFEVDNWFNLAVPAGTSKDIVAKLNAEVHRILQMPDVKEKLATNGMVPIPSTPEQADAHTQAEIAKWAKVIKDAGIRVD